MDARGLLKVTGMLISALENGGSCKKNLDAPGCVIHFAANSLHDRPPGLEAALCLLRERVPCPECVKLNNVRSELLLKGSGRGTGFQRRRYSQALNSCLRMRSYSPDSQYFRDPFQVARDVIFGMCRSHGRCCSLECRQRESIHTQMHHLLNVIGSALGTGKLTMRPTNLAGSFPNAADSGVPFTRSCQARLVMAGSQDTDSLVHVAFWTCHSSH